MHCGNQELFQSSGTDHSLSSYNEAALLMVIKNRRTGIFIICFGLNWAILVPRREVDRGKSLL